MCRSCGATDWIDSARLTSASPSVPLGASSGTADDMQAYELLQIFAVVFAVVSAGVVLFIMIECDISLAPAIATFLMLLLSLSVGGLACLSVARRRLTGKSGGLTAVDSVSRLNWLGLTSEDMVVISFFPAVMSFLGIWSLESSWNQLLAVAIAYGVIWGCALIVGRYRLRRR